MYDKAEVFWKVKVDDELDEGFEYTFPILAYNQRNLTDKTEFKVKAGEPTFSEYTIDTLKETIGIPIEKTYTKEIALSCNSLLQEMLENEANFLNCTVSNKGNKELESVKLCYRSECQLHSLLIGEKKEATFIITELQVNSSTRAINVSIKTAV